MDGREGGDGGRESHIPNAKVLFSYQMRLHFLETKLIYCDGTIIPQYRPEAGFCVSGGSYHIILYVMNVHNSFAN